VFDPSLLLTQAKRVVERPVILVLGVLVLPLLLAPFSRSNTGEDDAEAEGRELQQLPRLPTSWKGLASYPKKFEAFFDDQFPLRLPLVKLSAWVRYRVFGVSPNAAVMIGQDGWFFDGVGRERVQGDVVRMRNHYADHQGLIRYKQAELERWERVLEERRVVLAERGTHYVFGFAPSKRMVYPEYLPAALAPLKRETRLEQLGRYLQAHSKVAIVDLTSALLAAKKSTRPLLFYKTDGHWNYYGAFVAYRALVEGANRAFADQLGPLLDLDDFLLKYDQHWAHPRFTAMMGVPEYEPYVRLVAKKGNPLAPLTFTSADPAAKARRKGFRQVSNDDHGRGTVSLGREGVGGIVDWPEKSFKKQRYRYITGTKKAKAKRIFVLGDSFIEKAFYLFAAHAKEVYGYREVLGFPDELLKATRPNIVVHVITQGFMLSGPPKNPDSMVQAYLRIKHRESKRLLFACGYDEAPQPHGAPPSDAGSAPDAGSATSDEAVPDDAAERPPDCSPGVIEIPSLDAQGDAPVVIAVAGSGNAKIAFQPKTGRALEREPKRSGEQFLEITANHARAGGRLIVAGRRAEGEGLRVWVRQFSD
jgi:hypothetical protein